MPTPLTNPVTVPAVAQKVFDQIWVKSLIIQAPLTTDPTRPAKCRVVVNATKIRTLEDGTQEELPGGETTQVIADFFADAATEAAGGNLEMVTVMTALMALIKRKGNL